MTETQRMGKLECGVSVNVIRGTCKGECGVVGTAVMDMCIVVCVSGGIENLSGVPLGCVLVVLWKEMLN